jgi:hypothetical protein
MMMTAIAISPMMRKVLSAATIPLAAVRASDTAAIALRIVPMIRPTSPVCARDLWQATVVPGRSGDEVVARHAQGGER